MALELAGADDLTSFRTADPTTLLTQAEALVREFCGWHIAPERTETVTLSGGGASVFLPSLHVTAVTAVTEDGVALDVADLHVGTNGVLGRGERMSWLTGHLNVEVTFTHGYAEVPPVVQSVVLDIANRATSVVKAGGLIRLRVGGVDRQFGSDSGQPPIAIGLTDDNKAALGRKYWIP